MNNNSYIFYGTESEWAQNQSNFDFPYIAYTHDAGNVYISPFEASGGGHNYQTYSIRYEWNNFKYLRDSNGQYATVQFRFAGSNGEDQPYNTASFNYERDGWTLTYNKQNDTLVLSKQITVDMSLSFNDIVAYLQTLNGIQVWMVAGGDGGSSIFYNQAGYELLFNGWMFEGGGWGALHPNETTTVLDLMTQAGYISNSTLGNVSITKSMDELFEYDSSGSGTPFTAYNTGYIHYTGLNTIYDSTGARQTSIPMRIVFNGQTHDFTVGGNSNVGDSFNGLYHFYIGQGQDVGNLSLSLRFEYDVALTDAEKIALLSNTDYTLYYTGSNIYNQAGDEYQCNASSDSNGYILAQFSEYDLLVQNGTVADSTQTYNIWDNFTQVQGGSGTDINIPVTYTIQNLNGIYCGQFDDGEEIGNSITVTNSFTHGEEDVCYHRPMDLRIFDTREVSPDDIWDEQYAQYVHELTLDSDFTDTEICGALFSYDSTNDELTITYDGINFTSGTTASDVMSDTSSYENGIRIAIKGESLNYWKYNTFNEDGDYVSTDKKWNDCGNEVYVTDYILNIAPLNAVYEVASGQYDFVSSINETIDVLTDRFVILKDYFYIEYLPSTYPVDQTIYRPGNNVLKLEYSNWEGTSPSNINSFSLEYSLDYQQTWQTMNVSQNSAGQILIPAHEDQDDYYNLKVWFRAPANASLSNGISDNQYYAYTFKNEIYENGTYTTASALNGIECYTGGNIMTLIYGEAATVNGADFINDYPVPSTWCFNSLFRGLTTLTGASDLWMPAAITEGCYAHMYQGTHISQIDIKTPDYDPFNRAALSYSYICYGCTNLGTVNLYTSLLYSYQFSHAFDGCSALQNVWIYKFGVPGSNETGCTDSWLNGVSASGTIYYNSTHTTAVNSLPTNSSSGIPSGWTTEAQDI